MNRQTLLSFSKESLVDLVLAQQVQIAAQAMQIDRLTAEVARLSARVNELEAKLDVPPKRPTIPACRHRRGRSPICRNTARNAVIAIPVSHVHWPKTLIV